MKRRLGAFALLAIGVIAAAGCGKLSGIVKPNASPHTTLFVQGPVDTVNHRVHLYWFGTDVDGTIAGFEVRLLNPLAPADSSWRFTTRTDTLLTVFTPTGATTPTFEVRAIDNSGNRDPNPARQLFLFRNRPPLVTLTVKPNAPDKSDTTFASVTVGWNVSDPDGDEAQVVYRVWLDGREATPEITTARTFTMPSDRFRVGGVYASGYRSLYVQGIDDGGMAGSIDSVRWFVRSPVTGTRARLLLIDDVPRNTTSNFTIDTLYSNTAVRNLAPDQYSILQLDFNQPFKSALDMEQTFKLFESVVWYRGSEITTAAVLQNFEDGLGAYLEAGGKFYLDGLYLFSGLNADGALTEDFAREHLNCNGFRKAFVTVTSFTDSTIGWANVNNSVFRSTMFADSTRQQLLPVLSGRAGGFRVFNVRNAAEIAIMAPPGALTPASPDSLPIGVSVAQPHGGRAVILSVPLGTSTPRNASTSSRFLAKVFAQLGLTTP